MKRISVFQARAKTKLYELTNEGFMPLGFVRKFSCNCSESLSYRVTLDKNGILTDVDFEQREFYVSDN